MTRSDAIAQYLRALAFAQIQPAPTTIEAFLAADTAAQNALLAPWLTAMKAQKDDAVSCCTDEAAAIAALVATL